MNSDDIEALVDIILNDGLEHELRSGIPKLWHVAALHIPGVTRALEAKFHLPLTDVYEYFRENYGRKHYVDGQYDPENPDESHYSLQRCLKRAANDQNTEAVFHLMLLNDHPDPSLVNLAEYVAELPNPTWAYKISPDPVQVQLGYLLYKLGIASPYIHTDYENHKSKTAYLSGLRNDKEIISTIVQHHVINVMAGLAHGGHVEDLGRMLKENPIGSYPLSMICNGAARGGHPEVLTLEALHLGMLISNAVQHGSLVLLRAATQNVTVSMRSLVISGREYMYNLRKSVNGAITYMISGISSVTLVDEDLYLFYHKLKTKGLVRAYMKAQTIFRSAFPYERSGYKSRLYGDSDYYNLGPRIESYLSPEPWFNRDMCIITPDEPIVGFIRGRGMETLNRTRIRLSPTRDDEPEIPEQTESLPVTMASFFADKSKSNKPNLRQLRTQNKQAQRAQRRQQRR